MKEVLWVKLQEQEQTGIGSQGPKEAQRTQKKLTGREILREFGKVKLSTSPERKSTIKSKVKRNQKEIPSQSRYYEGIFKEDMVGTWGFFLFLFLFLLLQLLGLLGILFLWCQTNHLVFIDLHFLNCFLQEATRRKKEKKKKVIEEVEVEERRRRRRRRRRERKKVRRSHVGFFH